MSTLEQRMSGAVAAVPLVDTHEHLLSESERNRAALDLGYLFPHYASSDLVSSGMPPAVLEAVRIGSRPVFEERIARIGWIRKLPPLPAPSRTDLSPQERWRALAPSGSARRPTGYGQCLRIAMRDIFGVDDLNERTHEQLSAAIAASRRPGWYRHVLRDRARIEVAIQDDYRTDVDRELFVPALRLDHFACPSCRADLAAIEADTGGSVHGLDDLVQAMQAALERGLHEGAVCVKIGIAYRRSIRFERTPRADAERTFDALFGHLGEGPSWRESRPLQDYLYHRIVQAAVERDVPIQIHTGLLEGNGNLLENSNPLHLAELCLEYRKARIDLFHGGYPFLGEALSLAKAFPGVHLDLCWLPIVSPGAAARLLHEALETVPSSKIFAFGGDYIVPEGSYGASVMARRVVSRVLTEKVQEGWLGEEEAGILARRMLRENPAEFFRLKLAGT